MSRALTKIVSVEQLVPGRAYRAFWRRCNGVVAFTYTRMFIADGRIFVYGESGNVEHKFEWRELTSIREV